MDNHSLTIREVDYKNDLDKIAELLQQNHNTRLTKDFLTWKHLQNPFGVSKGLVVMSNDMIVGVRLFLSWQLRNKNNTIRVMRPVDTVVDKQFRNKGIFKMVTLEGIALFNNEYDIIMNTPNDNSSPGYLKMGWNVLEAVSRYKLGFIIPLFHKKTTCRIIPVEQINYSTESYTQEHYCTNKTNAFLQWRYHDPVYRVAEFGEGNYIVFKVIKKKFFSTMIIYEILGKKSLFPTMINSLSSAMKVYSCYYYDDAAFEGTSFILKLDRKQPHVLVKNDKNNIQNNIHLSLGDLEAVI